MQFRAVVKWTMLVVVLAVHTGCSVGYNGAVNLDQADRDAMASYHQFLKQRDLALEESRQAEAVKRVEPGLMTNRSAAVASSNTPLRPLAPARPLAPLHTPVVARRQPVPVQAQAGSFRPQLIALAKGAAVKEATASSTDGARNFRHITFATEGSDFDPVLSPDGKWLIFASTRHRAYADLYMKRTNGSAVTQLTSDPDKDVMPAISSDGKTIAFTSSRAGNWDIYLMDINGGQPIQLTFDPAAEIHPSFSPDGKWLVYCQYAEPAGRWELVLLELANPAVKRFIGYGLFPNWSPVDNRIVFQRARGRGDHFYSIWTIDLVDGEALRPTEVATAGNAAAITPDWSPDGKHIVFSTVLRDDTNRHGLPAKRGDIWVIDVDGRNRSNLTRSRATNLQPVWATDGTIYFTSNRSLVDGENVWSLRPDRALQIAQRTQSVAAAKPAESSTEAAVVGTVSEAK
jgi:TolB protein